MHTPATLRYAATKDELDAGAETLTRRKKRILKTTLAALEVEVKALGGTVAPLKAEAAAAASAAKVQVHAPYVYIYIYIATSPTSNQRANIGEG